MAWNSISIEQLENAINLYKENKTWRDSIVQVLCCYQKPELIEELEQLRQSLNLSNGDLLETNQCIKLAFIVFKADEEELDEAAKTVKQALVKHYDASQVALFEEFKPNLTEDIVTAIVFYQTTQLNQIRASIRALQEQALRQAGDVAVVVGRGAKRAAQSRTSGADKYGPLLDNEG